jgi:hypothetical protein
MFKKSGNELFNQEARVFITQATTAANLLLKPYQQFVQVDSTGDISITLPPVADCMGKLYTFHVASLSATKIITIQDKDDSIGWFDFKMWTDEDKLVLLSDGSRWHCIRDGISKARVSDEAAFTVLPTMDGLVYSATKGSATQTITLPTPPSAPGMEVTFVCSHASGEINIDPGAATYTITGVGTVAAAATKDLKNTAASNAVGDSVTLRSDGGIDWKVVSVNGTWATT